MTLNYLFQNFLEQSEFARQANISASALEGLIDRQISPTASYCYQANGQVGSFISDHEDMQLYRFHLKGHLVWINAIQNLQIESQLSAQNYFFDRYNSALRLFEESGIGKELNVLIPEVLPKFDDALRADTWGHFINGVYGVCTKDWMPETILVKQVCVKFIDAFTATGYLRHSTRHRELLLKTVDLLDQVVSAIAPHELEKSSHQRCVLDVRARLKAGANLHPDAAEAL